MTNRSAFLDTIAHAEGTRYQGDDGYNVLFGSTVTHPRLFISYADHPRILTHIPRLGISTTAAGRYQLLERFYDAYRLSLHLLDFSPASQDQIALRQIFERGALEAVDNGDFETAIWACSNIWASLPNNDYGQPQVPLDTLKDVYAAAGGAFTPQEA